MKKHWLVITLAVLVIIGSASGWVYALVKKNDPPAPTSAEITALQFSFMKQYGTTANVTQIINPQIFEVAWTGADGSKNVSMNVGGIWVLIASQPTVTTPLPPSTTTTPPDSMTPAN